MKNIIHRITTKPGYIIIVFLLLVGLLTYSNYKESIYYKVKSGEATLICEFKDGIRAINPKHFEGYIEEEDVFVFDNGYNHNCWLEYKNKGGDNE